MLSQKLLNVIHEKLCMQEKKAVIDAVKAAEPLQQQLLSHEPAARVARHDADDKGEALMRAEGQMAALRAANDAVASKADEQLKVRVHAV